MIFAHICGAKKLSRNIFKIKLNIYIQIKWLWADKLRKKKNISIRCNTSLTFVVTSLGGFVYDREKRRKKNIHKTGTLLIPENKSQYDEIVSTSCEQNWSRLFTYTGSKLCVCHSVSFFRSCISSRFEIIMIRRSRCHCRRYIGKQNVCIMNYWDTEQVLVS